MEPKVRNVCFQMTQPENPPREILNSVYRWPSTKFAIIGYDSGTDILEGYLEFTSSIRFSTIQRRLPEAQVYLRVDSVTDTVLHLRSANVSSEIGTCTRQGHRNDLVKKRPSSVDGTVQLQQTGGRVSKRRKKTFA